MAKIHTHYDNLKVARLAPQEVIRAAYKALSQKYHPDKNPGDDKAARIMAIINSAYGTLADPQRRREHDEWIAAEEWEIEWLESTRHDDPRAVPARPAPVPGRDDDSAPPPPAPRWPWLAGLAVCLALGWAGGALLSAPPVVLAAAWGGARERVDLQAAHGLPKVVALGEARAELPAELRVDSWGGTDKAPKAELVGRGACAAPFRVAAVAEVVVPAAPVECGTIGGQTRLTPNGDPWPARSGPLDGFPVENTGDALQLTVDNGLNALPLFVRLYDTERRANVRFVYVLPHDKLTLERLTLSRYELRYQTVDVDGAGRDGCRAPPPLP